LSKQALVDDYDFEGLLLFDGNVGEVVLTSPFECRFILVL